MDHSPDDLTYYPTYELDSRARIISQPSRLTNLKNQRTDKPMKRNLITAIMLIALAWTCRAEDPEKDLSKDNAYVIAIVAQQQGKQWANDVKGQMHPDMDGLLMLGELKAKQHNLIQPTANVYRNSFAFAAADVLDLK